MVQETEADDGPVTTMKLIRNRAFKLGGYNPMLSRVLVSITRDDLEFTVHSEYIILRVPTHTTLVLPTAFHSTHMPIR